MSDEFLGLPDNGPSHNDQLWLAEVLRHAAHEERPAFSEQLHARIMDAIHRSQQPQSLATTTAVQEARLVDPAPAVMVGASRASARRPARRSAMPWLAAAAALLLLAGGVWRLASLSPRSVGNNPVASDTASNYTWADLDHDARLSSQLVADQMPFEAPIEELALSNAN